MKIQLLASNKRALESKKQTQAQILATYGQNKSQVTWAASHRAKFYYSSITAS